MNARILSQVVSRATSAAALATISLAPLSQASAQSGSDYDPSTGIVYQKVVKTVERPVVEVEQQPQTVYRPQHITESQPEARTVYSPVVEYNWEPRLHGRWNPFRPPSVQYHHVPRTRWEARSEVVHRTKTRTEWVAETRSVPRQVVRMEREQKVDYVPVGQLDPSQAGPPAASQSIASRLRPLDRNASVAPLGASPVVSGGVRIAASTVGRMTSDPPRRSVGQGGMRATELSPSGTTFRGQPLPPASRGVGVANLAPLPIFR